jgi:hypothetical protein
VRRKGFQARQLQQQEQALEQQLLLEVRGGPLQPDHDCAAFWGEDLAHLEGLELGLVLDRQVLVVGKP